MRPLVVVDSTFATPLRQRPLGIGADIVLHSATKLIGGHSDLLLGAAICADPGHTQALRDHRHVRGAIPGVFEAYLAMRGLRTLSVRLERAEANAAELARRLSGHPLVDLVRYPGLPGDPGHARAATALSATGSLACRSPTSISRSTASPRGASRRASALWDMWTPSARGSSS